MNRFMEQLIAALAELGIVATRSGNAIEVNGIKFSAYGRPNGRTIHFDGTVYRSVQGVYPRIGQAGLHILKELPKISERLKRGQDYDKLVSDVKKVFLTDEQKKCIVLKATYEGVRMQFTSDLSTICAALDFLTDNGFFS